MCKELNFSFFCPTTNTILYRTPSIIFQAASGIPSAAKKKVAEPNKDKDAAKLDALLEAAGKQKINVLKC